MRDVSTFLATLIAAPKATAVTAAAAAAVPVGLSIGIASAMPRVNPSITNNHSPNLIIVLKVGNMREREARDVLR